MAEKGLNSYSLSKFGRIDVKPEEFDRTIYQKGARAIWEKAMLCSCLDEYSGQPDPLCSSCHGKAFLYFDAKEIRAYVSGLSGDNQSIPIGLLDVGSAYLTTMSTDLVNFRDRITFPDMLTAYSQVLKYEGEAVRMKYFAKEILSVRVLNTEIPATSYELSEDGNVITFVDGTFAYGERFSVLIKTNPVYIVIDMPHDLRGTFVAFGKPEEEWVPLPKQLVIKREDLMPLKRGDVL
jgi:hypothetical protein